MRTGSEKRTLLSDYRVTHRAGQGVVTLKTQGRNGPVVGIAEVVDDEELMLITRNGVIIRLPVNGVRIIGRNTQGVKFINLDPGDKVKDVERVVVTETPSPDTPEEENDAEAKTPPDGGETATESESENEMEGDES